MLHYEIYGNGKTVVLLHGYLENLKMWKDISGQLSENYRVVLIDLPGHGKSKSYKKVHSMEFMADKVYAVFEELGLDKTALVGHSMGGYVALAFAEKYPTKTLSFLLQNSTTLPDTNEKKAQRLKAVDAAHKNLNTLIKMSIPALFAEKNLATMKDEIRQAKALAGETSVRGVEAALLGMRERPDRTHLLSRFSGEIGIIIGKYDKAVNPEEFKKVVPQNENIKIQVLKTGHMSHLEDFPGTIDFIEGFLKRSFQ